MGTCFSKSKCADLGRNIWKRACTTCLKMRWPRHWVRAEPWICVALPLALLLYIFLCMAFRLRLTSCPAVAVNWIPHPRTPPSPIGFSSTCFVRIEILYKIFLTYFCLLQYILKSQTELPSGPSRFTINDSPGETTAGTCTASFLPTLPRAEIVGGEHGYSRDSK